MQAKAWLRREREAESLPYGLSAHFCKEKDRIGKLADSSVRTSYSSGDVEYDVASEGATTRRLRFTFSICEPSFIEFMASQM